MNSRTEQARITQLTSTYGPDAPPLEALDFGDFLSLLWRIDRHAAEPGKVRYYRQCVQALGQALEISDRSLFRLVEQSGPGEIYRQLPHFAFRATSRFADAHDRELAIRQLAEMRAQILVIGSFRDGWVAGWPGNGIGDEELRERVFAVLFTAFQGQFGNFARLLLVIDIVLSNLLLGLEPLRETTLSTLVAEHNYPNPENNLVQELYFDDDSTRPNRGSLR